MAPPNIVETYYECRSTIFKRTVSEEPIHIYHFKYYIWLKLRTFLNCNDTTARAFDHIEHHSRPHDVSLKLIRMITRGHLKVPLKWRRKIAASHPTPINSKIQFTHITIYWTKIGIINKCATALHLHQNKIWQKHFFLP